MNIHLAFLDEWGNNGLNFNHKGVSTHFIVTALILPEDKLKEAEAIVETVRKRHFQEGPLKSSRLGDNDDRRLRILSDLLTAPFRIFSLIIDKRELQGQGFYYKGSFYKFLHGLAERELARTFPRLTMTADRHGSDSFMESFIGYVQERHVPNLFNQTTFGFVASRDSMLVQAADIIAGSLARCYDETVLSPRRAELAALLRPSLLVLHYFPDHLSPLFADPPTESVRYDTRLAELSTFLAGDVLNKRLRARNSEEIDQATCLAYLLFHFRHVDPTRYISSRELLQHIAERRGKQLSLHRFQTRVIAPLRDMGVLIASSPKGYKLPAGVADLYDFLNHSNSIIQPLVTRVGRCVERVRLATNGEVDLLSDDAYKALRQALESKLPEV